MLTTLFFMASDMAASAMTFNFWDAALQKAVIAVLGAITVYYGAKAWKLRQLTAPQRRTEDNRYRDLRKEFEEMKRSLDSRLGTVEGLQRNTVDRAEKLEDEFGKLQRYVHDTHHAFSNAMNRALGVLEGQMEELGRNTKSGFDTVTKRIDDALALLLRRATSE